jgi:hypothetical protein
MIANLIAEAGAWGLLDHRGPGRSSASPGLDSSVLELNGYPQRVEPVPFARSVPAKPLKNRRAYLIGHPSAASQPQFSLQDNILLDNDDRLLHYRAPSEPGSSGSPIFDQSW